MGYGTFLLNFLGSDLIRNLLLYFVILLLFFKFFQKTLYSIFDPLVLNFLLPVACSVATILWLYIDKYIKFFVFIQLTSYFLFFLAGAKIAAKTKTNALNINYKVENLNFFKTIYYVNSALFLLTFSVYFRSFGFSNFDDKIGARNGNGIAIYLKAFFPLSQFILIQYKWCKYKKKSFFDYFCFLLIIFLSLISGSKAGLISLFCQFIVIPLIIKKIYLNEKIKINLFSKKNILLILIGVVSIIFFMSLTDNFDKEKILSQFALHFFEFGDTYYLSLPNDIYKELSHHSFIKFVFFSLIGPLYRFVPFSADFPIGFEIIDIVYHKTGSTTGPNARFFFMLLISGYVVLPYFFSMLMGFLLIRIRKAQFFGKSTYGLIFSIFLIFTFPNAITDISLFGVNFFALILFLNFTYLLSFIIYPRKLSSAFS